MQDKAIEFEATRIKVAKTINKMKESKLNITKYEEIYNKILSNCKNENKNIPESITNNNTNFATDYLASNYSKAIKELELLLLELSKYEIYIKVSSFTKYLKVFINNNDKNEEDFKLYRNSLLDILNKLLYSNTLDYEVEGKIIEEIYQITYYFIKEEFKNLGYSITLNELRNNQTHLIYLDREIEKELETLNLKDPKYHDLLTIKNKIDSTGINGNYAEDDLFRQLVKYELNNEKIKEIIDKLLINIDNNINEISNCQNQKENLKKDLKKNKERIKELKKDISKSIILFVTSGSIIAGLILGSIKLAKIKKFKTIKTTYSPKNGIIREANYYNKLEYIGKDEGTYVIELSPYEKENTPYKRTEKTYYVSTIEDIPIEKYLELDLESLKVTFKERIEETNSLNLDDVYEETIRYVEQIEIDESDYQKKTSAFLLIVFLFLSFLLELLMEYIFQETGFNDDYGMSLYIAIEDFLDYYGYLKEKQKEKELNIKEINELNQKFKELLKNNEENIQKLLNYYKMIKGNPKYHEEVKKINATLKRTLKKDNN